MRIAGYILIALNVVLWTVLIFLHLWIGRMLADTYGVHRGAGDLLWLMVPILIVLLSIGRPIRNFRAGRLNLGNGTLTATLILLPFYAFILLRFTGD